MLSNISGGKKKKEEEKIGFSRRKWFVRNDMEIERIIYAKKESQSIVRFQEPVLKMSTHLIECRMEIANHSKYTEIQFRVGNVGAL